MTPDNRNKAENAAYGGKPHGSIRRGLVFVATEFRAMFLHKHRDIPREFRFRIIGLTIFIPCVLIVHRFIPEQYRTAVVWALILASCFIAEVLGRKMVKKQKHD